MKEKYLLLSIILSVFLILFFTTSFALIPGDFGSTNNGPSDGVVDFEDLMIFALTYGSTSSDPNWNPVCDIAGPDGKLTPDGVIDFEDLMVFAMHYGECDEDTSLSPITLSDSITFAGKTFINGGEHTITVKFAVPVASVRVFITNYSVREDNIRNLGIIPSDAVEVAMTTVDGKTYIGTADFGWGNCVEEWIYVLSGESCCPVVCSRTVIVDSVAPYVALEADMVACDLGDCPPYTAGHKLMITTVPNLDECDPLYCCGDDCTEEVVHWTVRIYNWYVGGYGAEEVQPYECSAGECVFVGAPLCELYSGYYWYGDSCNVSYTGLCVADSEIWKLDYKVIVTLEDIVGNTRVYNGKLEIDTGSGIRAFLNDVVELTGDCQAWTQIDSDNELGRTDCFNSQ